MAQHAGLRDLAAAGRAEADAYRGNHDRPLGGYLVVMLVYTSLVATAVLAALLTGRKLPRDLRVSDIALMAMGTHKLARTISKDAVTSPLRAPFTRYADTGGPAEVMEEVRKPSGLRHSLGELLSCPFCLDMWVVTGFTVGHVFAPRVTRLVVAAMAALTGADFLQLAYAKAQQIAEG
ncbi:MULTISPECIES: DUF1360 domain-containing protein [Amycolatopsis]|uniref:DUF1360 domain-containing protein n=1 Tax=Amycolatopsis tucumanensis TaxID=401106 RepID=A0ABP7J774_9PSEU|nr:DUF1360 domain-containing protein [Amycolatopsis tucumanensis]MCF6427891.1 DUF1360 domain-containing protein [Amycolatopsis tucumanensis]